MISYGIAAILCGVFGLFMYFSGWCRGARKGYLYAYNELAIASADWQRKKRIDSLYGRENTNA